MAVSDDGEVPRLRHRRSRRRDWNTWKVLDVATSKPLADELKWVKFSVRLGPRTTRASSTAASRNPKEAEFQDLNVDQKLYYHRSRHAAEPTTSSSTSGRISRSGRSAATSARTARWLIISVGDGTTSRKARIAVPGPDRTLGIAGSWTSSTTTTTKFNFLGNDGARSSTSRPTTRAPEVPGHRHRHRRTPDKKNWKTIIRRSGGAA